MYCVLKNKLRAALLGLMILGSLLTGAQTVLASSQAERAADAPTSLVAKSVYRQTLGGCVWIVIPDVKHDMTFLGSGSVIDVDRRLVLTCYHVVGDHPDVTIYFPEFEKKDNLIQDPKHYIMTVPGITGHVLLHDETRDLAIVQLDTLPEGVHALSLAPTRPAHHETLHAVGNSGVGEGFEGKLWSYKTTQVEDVIFMPLLEKTFDDNLHLESLFIITPAKFDHGDSGAGVVNNAGQLVGVVAAITDTNSVCIDLREIKAFLAKTDKILANQRGELPLKGTSEVAKLPAKPIVGSWKLTLKSNGKQADMLSVTFDTDETWEIAGSKGVMAGKYVLSGGALTMVLDNDQGSAPLTWNGPDHFEFTTDGSTFICDRR